MLDIVFCVFGCDTIPKYRAEIEKIQETWGQKVAEYPSAKLLFMLGEETTPTTVGESYVHLPTVQNDYLSASYKQFLGLKYIYEQYPCHFVFVCGTDTFVNVPAMMAYISLYSSQEKWYIGGHGAHRIIYNQDIYFHSGGAGFLLSHASQTALYPQYTTAVDRWLAICKDAQVENLAEGCDVAMAFYVQEIADMSIVKSDRFWGCDYRGQVHGYPCHEGLVKLDRLLTCHHMSLDDFDRLTYIMNRGPLIS